MDGICQVCQKMSKAPGLSAQIRALDSGFEARLSDERRIERKDVEQLADALHAIGVDANATFCGDWREGDRVLMAGQKIALFSRLRSLEHQASLPSSPDFGDEKHLLSHFPCAVIVGVEALRRAGWTTQIPTRAEVAVDISESVLPLDQFILEQRQPGWFASVQEHLVGDRNLGLPWLAPAWALADMLHRQSWGNCGLWPDDIEWNAISATDEADWCAASEAFELPTSSLLSMRVAPR